MVLEAAEEIGHSWRSRWKSLQLFTRAEHDALPGMPFPAPAGTYPGKEAVADYLRTYAVAFGLSFQLNARVTGLRRTDAGFQMSAAQRTFSARQVIAAKIDVSGVPCDGRLAHHSGVTDVPRLHFLGLSWQHTRGSVLLGFVADDAAHVARAASLNTDRDVPSIPRQSGAAPAGVPRPGRSSSAVPD